MIDALSDEELLARGDAESFAVLYERRYRLIRDIYAAGSARTPM